MAGMNRNLLVSPSLVARDFNSPVGDWLYGNSSLGVRGSCERSSPLSKCIDERRDEREGNWSLGFIKSLPAGSFSNGIAGFLTSFFSSTDDSGELLSESLFSSLTSETSKLLRPLNWWTMGISLASRDRRQSGLGLGPKLALLGSRSSKPFCPNNDLDMVE